MGPTTLVAVLVVIAAVVLIVRGWDVRLVLLAAALTLGSVTGLNAGWAARHDPTETMFSAFAESSLAALATVLREFLGTFSNEKFVVPICSAMGFAYVLRHTGCERHLVLVLVKPLRYVRWLLIPGVILVGFIVNVPVISQTSTAVCIGPVVVPLMRAARYSMATIGTCLLLGASVGGELLNPGAPELLTVFDRSKVSTVTQAQQYLPPLVFTQLVVSVLVCWLMSFWWERSAARHVEKTPAESALVVSVLVCWLMSFWWERSAARHVEKTPAESAPASTTAEPERINLLKAAVPLVPLALLFATGLPDKYRLFEIPDLWVILPKGGQRDSAYSSRLIGLAMLVGVLVAMLVTPSKARDCVKHFFDGAGYGFATIVSLIVTANCFGVAIKGAGLAAEFGRLVEAFPALMQPAAALVPMAFAAVSGSGMASTQSLYGPFHDLAVKLGLGTEAQTELGALVSLGAAAGRTMSPVAAVTLMCGTLTTTSPFTLAKRVAVPLLSGLVVVVAFRMCGIY